MLRLVAMAADDGTTGISCALDTRRNPAEELLLSSEARVVGTLALLPTVHWLGEPRIGGNEGGVNLPDLEWRRGEDRGDDTGQGTERPPGGGDTVHGLELPGGEVPQAEPALEPLEVRRLCGTGGVPIVNCT